MVHSFQIESGYQLMIEEFAAYCSKHILVQIENGQPLLITHGLPDGTTVYGVDFETFVYTRLIWEVEKWAELQRHGKVIVACCHVASVLPKPKTISGVTFEPLTQVPGRLILNFDFVTRFMTIREESVVNV